MCDDEREIGEVRWVRGEDIRNVTSVRASVNIVVQFCQETNGFFGAITTDASGSLEKEVVSCVSR